MSLLLALGGCAFLFFCGFFGLISGKWKEFSEDPATKAAIEAARKERDRQAA